MAEVTSAFSCPWRIRKSSQKWIGADSSMSRAIRRAPALLAVMLDCVKSVGRLIAADRRRADIGCSPVGTILPRRRLVADAAARSVRSRLVPGATNSSSRAFRRDLFGQLEAARPLRFRGYIPELPTYTNKKSPPWAKPSMTSKPARKLWNAYVHSLRESGSCRKMASLAFNYLASSRPSSASQTTGCGGSQPALFAS